MVNESLCAPLLGVKFGPEIKVSPNFKINPGMGLALNFEDGGYTSLSPRPSSTITRPISRTTSGRASGSGTSRTGLGHAVDRHPVRLAGVDQRQGRQDVPRREGRMFTRTFDAGLENNYQFWAGIRYVIR